MTTTSSISLLSSAASANFAQPQAAPVATTATTTATTQAAAPAVATAQAAPTAPTAPTAQQQAAATAQSTQPRDPGPTELEPDGKVKNVDDTMSWLRGQMQRPRVHASSSQTESLADLHSRLLAGYKSMMDIWTAGG